jgi:hypothetical protein
LICISRCQHGKECKMQIKVSDPGVAYNDITRGGG